MNTKIVYLTKILYCGSEQAAFFGFSVFFFRFITHYPQHRNHSLQAESYASRREHPLRYHLGRPQGPPRHQELPGPAPVEGEDSPTDHRPQWARQRPTICRDILNPEPSREWGETHSCPIRPPIARRQEPSPDRHSGCWTFCQL